MRVLPVVTMVMAGSTLLAHAQFEPRGTAPSADGLQRLTEFFDNEIATGKIPGAIVLIRQHGVLIYFKCFGVRDVATKQAMTPDTISMMRPRTSVEWP